ncbi:MULTISPECIES: AAA family ATPase [unclassified Aureimonas]|uniref:AAA family ATPase n=1 Tax=unclassified Aureimonas TaxID=2615206 RepID=UPI0006FB4A0B|nr:MULTISPECIES: AAA family ATPase [unclassified Aureimonas]KQT61189.1 hypothetical protein ASG62_24090 [Aureimonas sp. Leaf427]KQT62958.1 hypothetical protein ASG54_23035 [Aureimonas sp. Leaf460]
MDDNTMTLHDVFVRHRLYKVTDAEVGETLRGERMTWIYDLLQGAAPAAGDLATDVRLWQRDLQSRGHCTAEPEALWIGMAGSRPDLVWLQPLLDKLGHNKHDVLRCRYYLAVLGDEGSARYLSRVAERSHNLSGAFSHGMYLHSKNLERIGASYAWYPGVETMILVEGCRRLAGLKGADRSVQAVVNWWNQTRRDRYAARMDGERRFLSALIDESRTRALMRKAVDANIVIQDPVIGDDDHLTSETFYPRTVPDKSEGFGDMTNLGGGLGLRVVPGSGGKGAGRGRKEPDRDETVSLEAPISPTHGHVVLRDLGDIKPVTDRHSAEVDLIAQISRISGRPIELAVGPDDVRAIAADLKAAWPHAATVIERILVDVREGEPVRLRPTLVVGAPGSGKTALVSEIVRRLGVPSILFPCASVSDSSFGGTPAQWGSRRVSTPLELIRTSDRANPTIILDELEKTGRGGSYGGLMSAILPMLERHSASAYFEVGIERTADLSRVNFLATANDLADLPAPLRDRFRVVKMPEPGPEHIGSLTKRIVEDLARESGIDPRWTPPLAPDEVDIIRRTWSGGSLRKLRRAVEISLDLREADLVGRAM